MFEGRVFKMKEGKRNKFQLRKVKGKSKGTAEERDGRRFRRKHYGKTGKTPTGKKETPGVSA